jgi:hypothetical protein
VEGAQVLVALSCAPVSRRRHQRDAVHSLRSPSPGPRSPVPNDSKNRAAVQWGAKGRSRDGRFDKLSDRGFS